MPDPLVLRLASVLPGLRPDPSGRGDWLAAAARSRAPEDPLAAPRQDAAVASAELVDGLVRVVVTDAALVATLDEPLPVTSVPARCQDVPAAFAAATGRDRGRFTDRRLANPAYATLVVHDRAARGWPVVPSRPTVVQLADLPRAVAEADAGRPHRLVEWLERCAALVLADGVATRPGGVAPAVVPLGEPHGVGRRVAASMGLALRRLGVPDIERV